ncbi:DUF3047 domain-containing protein [Aromatoleum sp.]|uniref:DUF3047 domain-containing protein n=1 Tax=Aromatoleum sp. TaxID=2307007 RepID=UPI002FCB3516
MAAIRSARGGIAAIRRAKASVMLSFAALSFATAAHPVAAEPAQPAPFSLVAPGEGFPGGWRHQTLPKVERANRFDLVRDDGGTVLRVRSDASASALAHPLDVDPAGTPILAWRWNVSNPVAGSDFTRKDGDDYAGRVYVLFDFPVERLSVADRLKMTLARAAYGTELPTAAIAYVWGAAQPAGATGPNPYTDRVRMVVVDSGPRRAGEWIEVRRDVAADFRAAFGEAPPRIIGIAVSADTDNTGEGVTALFGDLRFSPRE